MNLKELADSISANLNKSDDFEFRKRIRDVILDIRARLIRQEYTKTGKVSSVVIQDLSKIGLQEAEDFTCESCINKKVYRTTDRIPNPIRFKMMEAPFLFVGSNDRTQPFTYANPEEVEDLVKIKSIAHDPFYSYIDKYIYVWNCQADTINIRAPFGDPLELRKLKDCTGNSCFTGDFEIEEDMNDVIERMVYEKIRGGIPIEEPTEVKIDEPERNIQQSRR